MFHRVGIIDARDDDRAYAGYGTRMLSPYDDRAKAAAAIGRAAAAVAIRYAGMDVTPEQALDETFGTEDLDERQQLSDIYHMTFYNLLDGAEAAILDQIAEDDERLEECDHWVCTTCDHEWTGPSSECWSCTTAAELAAAEEQEREPIEATD